LASTASSLCELRFDIDIVVGWRLPAYAFDEHYLLQTVAVDIK
jgi:hypothetical protein